MKEIYKMNGVTVKLSMKIPEMGRIRIKLKDPEFSGEYEKEHLDASIHLVERLLTFIQENELV